MKPFLLRSLFVLLLACPFSAAAQGAYGMIGYGISKFVYRPANLDIARYNLDRDAGGTPMRFPDYMRGMSFGLKLVFNDYSASEFFLYRGQVEGKNTVTDSLGNTTTYELRCRVSSFAFGGAFGVKNAKLGIAFNMGTFSVASRFNDASWEATFEKKSKLWFGHTVYLSLILPLGKAALLELRPYWTTSWFSVRMGSTQPLIAFRPSNFGVMLALGLGQSE